MPIFNKFKHLGLIEKFQIARHLKQEEMLKTETQIASWLEKYNITEYTIHDDLTVDVFQTVDLSDQKLAYLPVQFARVQGSFSCSHNYLTTLKGAPREVTENVSFYNNRLTGLIGCPQKIGGFAKFDENRITSLEGLPDRIYGNLGLSRNEITSLKYMPRIIQGNCELECNPIADTNGYDFQCYGIFKITHEEKIPELEPYYRNIMNGGNSGHLEMSLSDFKSFLLSEKLTQNLSEKKSLTKKRKI